MRKHFITAICLISLLLFLGGQIVQASTAYGFETTSLSEEEIESRWKYIHFVSVADGISLEHIKEPIVCFDVSKDSMILLGFDENTVAITDKNGKMLQCFKFANNGSFYVQWQDEHILLFLVRGALIVEISQEGQLINMVATDDHSIENNSLWNAVRGKNNIRVDDASYCLRNQMGIFNYMASTYSQLVCTDSDGNEAVLFDVNEAQLAKNIVVTIGLFLFIAIVITEIFRQFSKTKKAEGGADDF